jgi:hypothetical protein
MDVMPLGATVNSYVRILSTTDNFKGTRTCVPVWNTANEFLTFECHKSISSSVESLFFSNANDNLCQVQ